VDVQYQCCRLLTSLFAFRSYQKCQILSANDTFEFPAPACGALLPLTPIGARIQPLPFARPLAFRPPGTGAPSAASCARHSFVVKCMRRRISEKNTYCANPAYTDHHFRPSPYRGSMPCHLVVPGIPGAWCAWQSRRSWRRSRGFRSLQNFGGGRVRKARGGAFAVRLNCELAASSFCQPSTASSAPSSERPPI
jgi:hypothetical protein